MSLLAFALVLTSACAHATWNFLAKRVSGDVIFVWLFNALATLIYFPIAVYVLAQSHLVIGWAEMVALVISTLLHLLYYFLLTRGYRVGDLSLVYPLARGTGPLLATLGAVLLLGERPPPLVIVGTVLIAVGVFIIAGNPFAVERAKVRPAIIYGLLTGLLVAVATLWDKQLVTAMGIPPLMLTWFGTLSLGILLFPYAYRYRTVAWQIWKDHRRETIGISILDSLGYILFLLALSLDTGGHPVSSLTPLRQVSILIGAFLGARMLSESQGKRRLAAAFVMLVGVVSLSIS